ncbi:dihydropyrimidine dehydrogenase [Thioclava sp. SK-1]|uniref:NAD(P)-dependent oxidoreductase n=1 Tax=Thioclava sp. SK-1 TaxID=1889770 RepID=UPI000825E31F|nr:NAD(P)-dependent oxidoreductase [Thioclava sp. SK-1]OCX64589.1 dihydropyrimidine dehydrogenase [Thioclava sp. SK-1]
MSNSQLTEGICANRLSPDALAQNFTDIAPSLTAHEAQVAADRCYFCHDAPCQTACPTDIDIPLFIRQIATQTPDAAGMTIFDSNILGGMCARVCPTENLCEGACVRMKAEGKPVEIGRLQRFATDGVMARQDHPYTRAAATGRTVSVIGAGPAGLACAHRLAMKGHSVTIYDARPKAGGLNEFGIASYKAVEGFAAAEVAWLMQIGGIKMVENWQLGRAGDGDLSDILAQSDAVFLGMGLSGVNALRLKGEDKDNIIPATNFIAQLRQASDLAALPIGRDVVVIGGGMTAVDAAVQAKLLGALNVTIVYRRGRDAMPASAHEQEIALSRGVRIIEHAAPKAIIGNGAVRHIEFCYTKNGPDGLEMTDATFRLPADQCFTAIGQTLGDMPEIVIVKGGKIITDGAGRTSMARVWAGGDCTHAGDDLTVTAVAQGRDAAEDIHLFLAKG